MVSNVAGGPVIDETPHVSAGKRLGIAGVVKDLRNPSQGIPLVRVLVFAFLDAAAAEAFHGR